MEIALSGKSSNHNQLQKSIYLYDRRNVSQIWQQKTFWQHQDERCHQVLLMSVQSMALISTSCTYGCQEVVRTRSYRLRSLQQGQIKITPWDCRPTLPTYDSTKYQLSALHSFWDIARTIFKGQGHYSKVKGHIKVTI